METFGEVETDGKITLILGGKVLIVGIAQTVCIKTLYASPANGATTVLTNVFLTDRIQEFPAETDKLVGEQDMKKAKRPMRGFPVHMQCLMELDGIAQGGGSEYRNSLADPVQGPFDPKDTPGDPSAQTTACSPPISIVPLTPLSPIPVSSSVPCSPGWVDHPPSLCSIAFPNDVWFHGTACMDVEFEHDYPQVPNTQRFRGRRNRRRCRISRTTALEWNCHDQSRGGNLSVRMWGELPSGDHRTRRIHEPELGISCSGSSSCWFIRRTLKPFGFSQLNPDSPVTPERCTFTYVSCMRTDDDP